MRTRTRIATAITTGVVATALLASPALARAQDGGIGPDPARSAQQTTQQVGTCDGTGVGAGPRSGQMGQGNGGQARGAGMGTGTRSDLTGVASGTLTDTQRSAVAALAEEEKLAHDLYVAFADQYGTRAFTRIASAETQHLTEVRVILDRYSITDPTADRPAGTFATAATQDLYDTLLADGSAGVEAAYTAARTVESTDITDLRSAVIGVTAPDALQVYANLLAGSQRHLVAFGG
ncbi:hypothetical protein BH11ACT1_BH11ACT1_14430 [soil metagenome]